MRRHLLLSAALLLATAAAFEGAAETYEYDDIDGNVEPDDAAASNANSSEMPPYPETIGDFVKLASDVGKGPAGECAVGLSCGAAAGWIVRRVQGALVATAIVSAIGTGAMLHLGWVTPETVRRRRRRSARAPRRCSARAPLLPPPRRAHHRRRRRRAGARGRRHARPLNKGARAQKGGPRRRRRAHARGQQARVLEGDALRQEAAHPLRRLRHRLRARLRDALTNTVTDTYV